MTRPVRLRLSRAKGFSLQAHSRAVNGLPAVNVARPSKWGNYYRIGDPFRMFDGEKIVTRLEPMSALEAVEHYRRDFETANIEEGMLFLRGKNLACWCALPELGEPDICHAAVLLELANRPICEAVSP